MDKTHQISTRSSYTDTRLKTGFMAEWLEFLLDEKISVVENKDI